MEKVYHCNFVFLQYNDCQSSKNSWAAPGPEPGCRNRKQMIPPPVCIFFDDGAIVMTDDSLLQKGVVKL